MAHFAELNENDEVVRVIVVANQELLDKEGNESEAKGAVFCNELLGGRWVQTSYNASFRKNYAGVGFKYDSQRNAFVPPKPFDSWSLDEQTCQWVAPIPYPQDGLHYTWDEIEQNWQVSE